jgi:hypothetical protein
MLHTDPLQAGSERLISAAPAGVQEDALERALRPKRLDEYIGQTKIREQLDIFVAAARARHESLDHVLLFGPAGARQDHPGAHRRGRNGGQSASDLRSCAGARRRPCRDPQQP